MRCVVYCDAVAHPKLMELTPPLGEILYKGCSPLRVPTKHKRDPHGLNVLHVTSQTIQLLQSFRNRVHLTTSSEAAAAGRIRARILRFSTSKPCASIGSAHRFLQKIGATTVRILTVPCRMTLMPLNPCKRAQHMETPNKASSNHRLVVFDFY